MKGEGVYNDGWVSGRQAQAETAASMAWSSWGSKDTCDGGILTEEPIKSCSFTYLHCKSKQNVILLHWFILFGRLYSYLHEWFIAVWQSVQMQINISAVSIAAVLVCHVVVRFLATVANIPFHGNQLEIASKIASILWHTHKWVKHKIPTVEYNNLPVSRWADHSQILPWVPWNQIAQALVLVFVRLYTMQYTQPWVPATTYTLTPFHYLPYKSIPMECLSEEFLHLRPRFW